MSGVLALVRQLRAAGMAVDTDRVALAEQALVTLPADPRTALRVSLSEGRGTRQRGSSSMLEQG
jgi:hypothetical protein